MGGEIETEIETKIETKIEAGIFKVKLKSFIYILVSCKLKKIIFRNV